MRLVALVHDDTTRTEDFKGGGCRHRKAAVGALDPAGALGDRRSEHSRFVEQFECDTTADDINNRVHRTDLMKVHLVRRHAVDLALGLGDTAKDGDRLFLHPVAERAAVDERPDVGKRALVRAAAVGVVTVRVGMAVLMRVLLALGWQEVDVKLDALDVRLGFATDVQLVAVEIELGQLGLERRCIDADDRSSRQGTCRR